MKKMTGMRVVAMVAVSAFGQNIYVTKSQDWISKDLPFKYMEGKTVLWQASIPESGFSSQHVAMRRQSEGSEAVPSES